MFKVTLSDLDVFVSAGEDVTLADLCTLDPLDGTHAITAGSTMIIEAARGYDRSAAWQRRAWINPRTL